MHALLASGRLLTKMLRKKLIIDALLRIAWNWTLFPASRLYWCRSGPILSLDDCDVIFVALLVFYFSKLQKPKNYNNNITRLSSRVSVSLCLLGRHLKSISHNSRFLKLSSHFLTGTHNLYKIQNYTYMLMHPYFQAKLILININSNQIISVQSLYHTFCCKILKVY